MVRLQPQPLKDLNDHAELTARTLPRSGFVHGARCGPSFRSWACRSDR